MCLESYIGSNANPEHPFISPINASDEVLKMFPKIRIMVASNDPLRDENFKFTFKLA
jgi:acetyl esterase/lipase